MTDQHFRSRYSWILYVLIGLAILLFVLFAGSNWLLNTPWLAQRLSQSAGIEIHWEHGRSRYPGQWEVAGFHLARKDDELFLSLDAAHATLSLSLAALFQGKVHILALDAQGIRNLTLNEHVLEGDGRLRLEDALFTDQHLEIARLRLSLEGGVLHRQLEVVPHDVPQKVQLARDISLTSAATLAQVAALGPDVDILGALSGTVQLDAHADAWDVFTPYLGSLPWLALSGSGRLHGELILECGVLAEGSILRLDSPVLMVEVDESSLRQARSLNQHSGIIDTPGKTHRAQGNGDVLLGVSSEQPAILTVTTRLRDVALVEATPYARQAELTLAADLDNLRMDKLEPPFRVHLAASGQVIRLDMLDPYLEHTLDGQGMKLRGAGQLEAELELLDSRPNHARLEIKASQLQVDALGYQADGGGFLLAELDSAAQVTVKAALVGATLLHTGHRLLADADLQLAAISPFDPKQALEGARGEIAWENARLPDISALQPYLTPFLPDPEALTLLGGEAQCHGQLELTANQLRGSLSFSGRKLRTQIQTNILESDVDLSLLLNEATLDNEQLDISGSRLRWLATAEKHETEGLESEIFLREGRLHRRDGVPGGRLALEGSVHRLGFLNAFLPKAHGLAVEGNGRLYLRADFEGLQILPKSELQVTTDELRVRFLDYQAAGRGDLFARLDTPDEALFTLSIPRYTLQRQGEVQSHMEGRDLVVTTRTTHFEKMLESAEARYFTTHIFLPATEVPDVTRYNSYLPKNAGVTLLGGKARLSSEFTLTGLDAQGALDIYASEAELALLDQRLVGDLQLALNLTEGDLATRQFTLDHSFLRLDQVQHLMHHQVHRQEHLKDGGLRDDADWWVQLDFDNARLLWTDQIQLVGGLRLAMRDTGLLARLFLRRAGDGGWLGRLLDVRDIHGEAQLDLSNDRIRLSGVDLRGETLTLLADLDLAGDASNGAMYARLGALSLGVELNDNEPTLRIVRPLRWFHAWRDGKNVAP